MTTIAFLTVGSAVLVLGLVLEGDTADAIGFVAAGAFTGFAAVAVALGLATSPRPILKHPGPAVLTATAALGWWGAL